MVIKIKSLQDFDFLFNMKLMKENPDIVIAFFFRTSPTRSSPLALSPLAPSICN